MGSPLSEVRAGFEQKMICSIPHHIIIWAYHPGKETKNTTLQTKGKTWGDSHYSVNLNTSTRVLFEEYIERVKDVVDAVDYFYLYRSGKFD